VRLAGLGSGTRKRGARERLGVIRFRAALINRGNSLSRLQRYDDALAVTTRRFAQPGSARDAAQPRQCALELKRPEEAFELDKARALEAKMRAMEQSAAAQHRGLKPASGSARKLRQGPETEPDCPAALENRANA